MKKIRATMLAGALGCALLILSAGSAHATDPHYTDGTTCVGSLCPGGPPPLPPKWKTDQECKTLLVDPATLVFVTIHAIENGSEYGSIVTPYSAAPPHFDPVDVANLVQGHHGTLYLTWNIGIGKSETLTFDCRSPEPTTTTTAAPTTTTTVARTTTTTVKSVPPTTVPPVPFTPITHNALPNTGSDAQGNAIIAICGLTIGGLLVVGARRRRVH